MMAHLRCYMALKKFVLPLLLIGFLLLCFAKLWNESSRNNSQYMPHELLRKNSKLSLALDENLLNSSSAVSHNIVHAAVDNSVIEIALIFRHGSVKKELQNRFRNTVESLLRHSSAPLRIHVVTDSEGYRVASAIVDELHASLNKSLQLQYVATAGVELLSEGAGAAMVDVLQQFFTTRRNSYYRDPLFFFSLFLHNILPSLRRVILMDVDVRVESDITVLHKHFSHFQPHHVMGMSYELSPVYRQVLAHFRSQHPTTTLGSPSSEGGFPGYNSGIMLVDIPRLNASTIIRSYLEHDVLQERCQHYSFHGSLGDQDLYTLIALDHPHLFYTLPCTWNRQLCAWWRTHGDPVIFDQYFDCAGKVDVYHGNCNSQIPPPGS